MAAKSTPVVPSNNDPLLLAIGDAMGHLVAEVDALGMPHGADEDKALERLLGRIEDLTVAAAALPATGLEGALVQFVALASHVSDLLAHTGDSAEEARIRRLLDNIATVLERATDIDAERFGGPFFLYRAARLPRARRTTPAPTPTRRTAAPPTDRLHVVPPPPWSIDSQGGILPVQPPSAIPCNPGVTTSKLLPQLLPQKKNGLSLST